MIRLWRENNNDTTLAWEIPATVRRRYNQDLRVVQDSYDFPHTIITRSGNRRVIGVVLRFPRGILADESGAAAVVGPPAIPSTLQTLKSYLTEAYEEKHYVTLFDDDGMRYYSGRLDDMDELILCNESEYDDVDGMVSFAVIVTVDGTYSNWDSLTTTLTPGSRP